MPRSTKATNKCLKARTLRLKKRILKKKIEEKNSSIHKQSVIIQTREVQPIPELLHNGIVLRSGSSLITTEILDILSRAPKFNNWLLKDRNGISFTVLIITDINFFGRVPTPENLGFVKFQGDFIDLETGNPLPANIVFMRGDSVGAMVEIEVENSGNFFVFVKQLRGPICSYIIELCAGMMDASENFVGVLAKELYEELGITLSRENMVLLGNIVPSAGGCDETINLYLCKVRISQEEFYKKQRTVFGNEEEGERIRLIFVPSENLKEFVIKSNDAKILSAYTLMM